MKLNHTNILITGGSHGLGRALGRTVSQAGANVVLVAREPGPLEAAVAEIRQAGGVAHGIVADIGDKGAIHAIAHRAAALTGNLDVLVNNASTLGPTPLPLLLDTECEDLERVLAVNLVGPFRLTKLVAGAMAVRGRGLVVNISSDAAVEAYPGWGAYGISKAALDHLTRIWASELQADGVRFLAVDPGEMNTRMHARALPGADPGPLADPADVAQRIVELVTTDRAHPSGSRVDATEVTA